MPILTWEEIEPIAEKAFAVSVEGNERYWARYAWQILADAGLGEYEGELERHSAIIRFLALGGIYEDWSDVAWGDGESDPQYSYWVEDIGLSAFRLGQLAGATFDAQGDECEDSLLVYDALAWLADDARPEVVKALKEQFGSDSGLFVSLWRSRDLEYLRRQSPAVRALRLPPTRYSFTACFDDEADELRTDEEIEWEILNDATGEKLEAYAWVDQGCLPFR